MREIVFRVLSGADGQWEACSQGPDLQVSAPTLEELHHEAREALISCLGPSHISCRIRFSRRPLQSLVTGVAGRHLQPVEGCC